MRDRQEDKYDCTEGAILECSHTNSKHIAFFTQQRIYSIRYVTSEWSDDIYMVSYTVISCTGNSARTIAKRLHFLHPPKVSDADISLCG